MEFGIHFAFGHEAMTGIIGGAGVGHAAHVHGRWVSDQSVWRRLAVGILGTCMRVIIDVHYYCLIG